MKSINQYPIIFLTFKDANDTKEKVIAYLKEQILDVYDYYEIELDNLDMSNQQRYNTIKRELLDETAILSKITNAISFL